MAAPAPAPAKSAIDQNDVEDWKNQFNAALADTSKLTAPSPAGARPWNSSFFGCLNPIDTCAITCCLPCVTFGKVHHRVRKDPSMQGYEAINTSCIGYCLSSFVALHWVMAALQRSGIRQKYNLEGACLTDIAAACCCGCCDIIQQDKETELREKEGASQYSNKENTMTYPSS
ncbi:PLAC8-domain-containing protein [Eremomyces bilateralis CBS 781.70]|uniref:PLAC8-domain-containing protein n=1 Tax=Eremomyces bilateralis CBS 781.70 TaxID=1392243 RepID=A0A6G1G8X4_9PEZI|nr:PLAC8-domain-containing protein [Eremomyces bilateralis CBS 781.70]KAF1814555.1 PLAC8-domain-containing protein [Eremomyces bilateralis CBS 781.70]